MSTPQTAFCGVFGVSILATLNLPQRGALKMEHKHGVTMIYDRWNHSQSPPKKPPRLSYTHYNKARHEFLTSSPNKRSIRDKTQRNKINRMRFTSQKVHLSKTIHDWHRPPPPLASCHIVRVFMHLFLTRPNAGYVVQFCKQYLDRV